MAATLDHERRSISRYLDTVKHVENLHEKLLSPKTGDIVKEIMKIMHEYKSLSDDYEESRKQVFKTMRTSMFGEAGHDEFMSKGVTHELFTQDNLMMYRKTLEGLSLIISRQETPTSHISLLNDSFEFHMNWREIHSIQSKEIFGLYLRVKSFMKTFCERYLESPQKATEWAQEDHTRLAVVHEFWSKHSFQEIYKGDNRFFTTFTSLGLVNTYLDLYKELGNDNLYDNPMWATRKNTDESIRYSLQQRLWKWEKPKIRNSDGTLTVDALRVCDFHHVNFRLIKPSEPTLLKGGDSINHDVTGTMDGLKRDPLSFSQLQRLAEREIENIKGGKKSFCDDKVDCEKWRSTMVMRLMVYDLNNRFHIGYFCAMVKIASHHMSFVYPGSGMMKMIIKYFHREFVNMQKLLSDSLPTLNSARKKASLEKSCETLKQTVDTLMQHSVKLELYPEWDESDHEHAYKYLHDELFSIFKCMKKFDEILCTYRLIPHLYIPQQSLFTKSILTKDCAEVVSDVEKVTGNIFAHMPPAFENFPYGDGQKSAIKSKKIVLLLFELKEYLKHNIESLWMFERVNSEIGKHGSKGRRPQPTQNRPQKIAKSSRKL